MTLHQLLAKAYPAPEWALFFEVANSTGARANRYADAVALGIWPSRGYAVIGFECKTDRRDWLRERANPAKADTIVGLVDRFYLVTTPGVAATAEVPDTWGHLEANEGGTKLLTRRAAPDLPNRDRNVLARGFMASILRKVPETTVPKATMANVVEERVKEALARSREGHQERYLQAKITDLEAVLSTFQAKTGVDLKRGWPGPEKIGAAVQAVLDLEVTRSAMQLSIDGMANLLKSLATEAAAITQALAERQDQCSKQIEKPEVRANDGRTKGTDTTTGGPGEA